MRTISATKVRPTSDPAVPALTVAAVIERDGRFLMVEEWVRGQRVLNQPAGHVEAGESLVQAVVRETMEESGWVFAPEAVTGVYYWVRPGTRRGFLRVALSGSALSHDAGRRLDTGIIQALWLSRSEMGQHAASLRSPMVMRAVDDYLGGSRMPVAALNELSPACLLEQALRV